MNIIVTDAKRILTFQSPSPFAIISITSQFGTWPLSQLPPNCVGMLRLYFTRSAHGHGVFAERHARRIFAFVEAVGDVDLVVQGEEGRGRSAAVAAALAEIMVGSADAIIGYASTEFISDHIYEIMLDVGRGR